MHSGEAAAGEPWAINPARSRPAQRARRQDVKRTLGIAERASAGQTRRPPLFNRLTRGQRPGPDEIAAEAQLSRAMAYRNFPGLDALLSEAADAKARKVRHGMIGALVDAAVKG